jgi:hypothetical protein
MTMSQKYLKELIQYAQVEIPLLKYAFQNASTHYALQEACQKQFGLITYMLHHVILSAYDGAPAAPPPPAPVVVAPPPPPPPAPRQSPSGHLPTLPDPAMIEQPSIAPTQMAGMAEVNIVPGTTNVIITPQGTRVIAPTGAATVLPAGEAVDLAASTGHPEVPPAPPGVENIVLPPGGGMTPDVAAALESRQNPTD